MQLMMIERWFGLVFACLLGSLFAAFAERHAVLLVKLWLLEIS